MSFLFDIANIYVTELINTGKPAKSNAGRNPENIIQRG